MDASYVTQRNGLRLLFAVIFIVINIILLPFRIKSGFNNLQNNGSSIGGIDADSSRIGGGTIKIGAVNPSRKWTELEAYSPRRLEEANVRISFRLHDPKDEPRPYKFLSVDTFVCNNRADLPPSLGTSDEGRLFDFTTTVSTNLNSKCYFL